MRALAERTRDATLRTKLEEVANEYGRLADEAERDAK